MRRNRLTRWKAVMDRAARLEDGPCKDRLMGCINAASAVLEQRMRDRLLKRAELLIARMDEAGEGDMSEYLDCDSCEAEASVCPDCGCCEICDVDLHTEECPRMAELTTPKFQT